MLTSRALPECIDCGYELDSCVCVASLEDLAETHGARVAPDCEECGLALTWCAGHWCCFSCDDAERYDPDAEREP